MLETISKSLKRPWTALSAALLLVAVAGVSAAAVEGYDGDEAEKKVHKVRVKKVLHQECEGDCEEGEHVVRQIFVGDDGEVQEIEGGAGHAWVTDDDARVHVIKMGTHAGHGHDAMLGMPGMSGMSGKGGFLGVQLTDLTAELREHFGAPSDAGVMVSKVVDDSPATRAGIQVGDIISGVDGEPVGSGGELAHKVRALDDGATPMLEVWRAGKLENMTAAIEVRDTPQVMAGMPGAHKFHKIKVMCDEGEDCDVDIDQGIDVGDFDCGGASECLVHIKCEDSGCDCTINGEASDCQEIPGFAEHHGE